MKGSSDRAIERSSDQAIKPSNQQEAGALKDLRLEDLDQLELAAALELEAFQLRQRAVVLEHSVCRAQGSEHNSLDPGRVVQRFLSSLPSSSDAGRIIALYGPSTSKYKRWQSDNETMRQCGNAAMRQSGNEAMRQSGNEAMRQCGNETMRQ
eukprot:5077326-Prymnesium_polylepis.1